MDCPKCGRANPLEASQCEQCGEPFADKTRATLVDTADGWSAAIRAPESAGEIASLDALRPGMVLGARYEIVRRLGAGGMGAVYQATDRELDRPIALKTIRPDLASQEEILQRFKQELILARKVTHRNVIRIFDLGQANGIKFITMEYVEGEDLKSLLRADSRFSVQRTVEIIRQVCLALEAAHAEGVVHRDLKPSNIMLDAGDKVTVMDFGIAHSMDVGGMTRTGAVIGTPEYMSPEQAMGRKIDARSDLFSMGLIFYEMLTGKNPFESDTFMGTLMRRTQEQATPPSEVDPSIPPVISAIVAKCLETDPELRYQSAGEVIGNLDAGQPPTPTRTALSAKRRGFQIAPPLKWSVAGAALLLFVALLLSIPRVRSLIFSPGPETARNETIAASPAQLSYVGVIPFRILGDAADIHYIARGIGESLSARLFQLKRVYVPAFREAEKFGPDDPLEKIARELGVRLIVHGTIARAGDRIAVVVNLQDVDNGRQLWAKEYTGMIQDLLTLEDKIYDELLVGLQLTPDSEERARSATHSTENIEAYDLYLKGRNALRGRQDTANLKAAIDFFESALKKDSGFALAYVGLADAGLALYRATKDSAWAQRAVAAGEQAQRLNDQLPEVYLSLGNVFGSRGADAGRTETGGGGLTKVGI